MKGNSRISVERLCLNRIGIDIVDVSELREDFLSRQDVIERTYTSAEQLYCKAAVDPGQSFAARWAAKEALVKAFGSGWTKDIRPPSVEVYTDAAGAPHIQLHGAAAAFHASLGSPDIALSLSHLPNLAIAVVSICTKQP